MKAFALLEELDEREESPPRQWLDALKVLEASERDIANLRRRGPGQLTGAALEEAIGRAREPRQSHR